MAHKMGDVNPDKTLGSAFRVFDQDGSGVVDAGELKNVMRELGEPVDEEDIGRVLKSMDIDGDGSIDYHEFSAVVTKEMKSGGYSIV